MKKFFRTLWHKYMSLFYLNLVWSGPLLPDAINQAAFDEKTGKKTKRFRRFEKAFLHMFEWQRLDPRGMHKYSRKSILKSLGIDIDAPPPKLASTENFVVFKDPLRDPKSLILTINYKGNHFGHTWQLNEDWAGAATAGTWTFNRGDVAIANEYWPPVYNHASVQDLLNHLEETFKLKA